MKTEVIVIAVAFIALSLAIFIILARSVSARKKQTEEQQLRIREEAVRIQKRNAEQLEAMRKEQEKKERLIASMKQTFNAMPDWNTWESGLHEIVDQYNRIRRASEERITICAYDPAYKVAKVRGQSGEYYLCGPYGCSCPDFKQRILPCKHMYALAAWLNGDTEKCLSDDQRPALYGLYVDIAGRFKGGRDDVKRRINDLGGIWTDSHKEDAALLVCGSAPSAEKILWFEQHHLPILQEGDLDTIFRFEAES